MSELKEKMIKEMKLRNFAESTQELYMKSVYGLSKYYMRSPDRISNEEVKDYISYLIEKRELSWSSCNVAKNGIRFFLSIP